MKILFHVFIQCNTLQLLSAMYTVRGTPPYGHLVNTAILLLRSYFFMSLQNAHPFCYKRTPLMPQLAHCETSVA